MALGDILHFPVACLGKGSGRAEGPIPLPWGSAWGVWAGADAAAAFTAPVNQEMLFSLFTFQTTIVLGKPAKPPSLGDTSMALLGFLVVIISISCFFFFFFFFFNFGGCFVCLLI